MKYLINYFYYFIIAIVLIVIVAVNISESVETVSVSASDLPVIVIDAGHGGVDGGAVAADGTAEKDINLDIAIKLNELLIANGYSTVMIRDGDYSIHDDTADTIRKKKVSDLHNRLEIAENTDNSILVSIHQNYFTQEKYSGAQVFYSPNNNNSSFLAQCIQNSIVSSVQQNNTRQIKKSDNSIFLLHKTTVPAVMVECGFLSNQEEARKLRSDEYRQQIAQAVYKGIINYINGADEESSSSV